MYHFLGCQVITQEDSVCACECGRAAGQRDSKASLFERTRRKRWPAHQLGGTQCAQVCRGGSCAAGSWRAGRELWHSEAEERCIEQQSWSLCTESATHTHAGNTDYLKFICAFNISCSCGDITASLYKQSIKEEELQSNQLVNLDTF